MEHPGETRLILSSLGDEHTGTIPPKTVPQARDPGRPAETKVGGPGLDELWGILDLLPSERRSYEFLLRSSTASPAQVARETGQSRGRVYETLRRLVEKGLAREVPTRPVRYESVPLADVVAVTLAEFHRRTEALRSMALQVPAGAPQPPPEVLRPSNVTVFEGRRAVMQELLRLLRTARSFALLVGGGRLASRLVSYPEVLAAVRDAHARGVRTRLATTPSEARSLPVIEERGPGVPTESQDPADGMPVNQFLTEQGVLLVVPQPDDSGRRGDDLGVRLDGPVFVETFLRFLGQKVGVPRAEGDGPEAILQHLLRERNGSAR